MPYVHEVVELDPVGPQTHHGGYGGRAVPVGESSVLVTRSRRSSTTALTLLDCRSGESLLLSADTLKVERRLPLPSGRGSLTWRTSLFVAAGPLVGVGGHPFDVAYTVRPEHVVRLAAGWSHPAQATSPPIELLHHPVGVAADETLHVETELGFVALEAGPLAEVARTGHPGPRWSAWHDGLSAVVVLEQSREREAVHVYRWDP